MIYLKSPSEIEIMKRNGAILKSCFEMLSRLVKIGAVKKDIDSAVEEIILKAGAKPAFKGFHGFPAATCISVNEEVVHGIPNDRVLENGDICGVDIGVLKDGYYADAARTFTVGEISEETKKLLSVTRAALERAIDKARVGNAITRVIDDQITQLEHVAQKAMIALFVAPQVFVSRGNRVQDDLGGE